MSVCPHCHGKGLIEVTTAKPVVDWDTFPIFGWERPCDYPGCHGGVISCCEAPVNRWESDAVRRNG